MSSPLTNMAILVTGGTGSFGQAFVRHALTKGARKVAVLSRDELKQWNMDKAIGPTNEMRYFIGSVTDSERVGRAMRGMDMVVHAAAMKQIPTCEANPAEAVKANIIGTETVALAAIAAGVERCVFLSTDKAAAPNTLYGACKMVAERLWTQANVYAAGTPTKLMATRYGNVIGSRGSVIPLFRKQAAEGKALTITHPEMTRFWMRMDDAVALVELALREGLGGEVFVPLARACSILTVAEAVAPGVVWESVGIRRGEKLHEVLISHDEARCTVRHEDHFRIEPDRTWGGELPARRAPILADGFEYSSNTADQLNVEEMRNLLPEEDER